MDVKGVRFSAMSPWDIRAFSVCRVTSKDEGVDPETSTTSNLMDLRFGPHDRSQMCGTCGGDIAVCPGHFGHIELAMPVYQVGFAESVFDILRCVCHHCSMLLVDDTPEFRRWYSDLSKQREVGCVKVLREYRKKKRTCVAMRQRQDGASFDAGCGKAQPHYTFARDHDIALSWSEKGEKTQLKPQAALDILRAVSAEDVRLLGGDPEHNRPEWLIMTVLPVPPYCVRPSTSPAGGARDDEDLTYMLNRIIKANAATLRAEAACALRASSAEAVRERENCHATLQYMVDTYLDNEPRGAQPAVQRTGKPLLGFRQRIKGKDGRLRNNLNGKRGNGSGRTVASPEVNIGVNFVGVPSCIARNLETVETVNDLNYARLQRCVWRGPDAKDGANAVVLVTGETIDLRVADHRSFMLAPLQKVKRHLADGDSVVVNRQPSLHRTSLMSHLVKVLPGKSLRLPLPPTAPYNADLYPALRFRFPRARPSVSALSSSTRRQAMATN